LVLPGAKAKTPRKWGPPKGKRKKGKDKKPGREGATP